MSTVHDLFKKVADLEDLIERQNTLLLDLGKKQDIVVNTLLAGLKVQDSMMGYLQKHRIEEKSEKTEEITREDLKERLSVKESALIVGKTDQTVYNWIRDGKLEAERVGGRWVIHRTVLLRQIKVKSIKKVKKVKKTKKVVPAKAIKDEYAETKVILRKNKAARNTSVKKARKGVDTETPGRGNIEMW